MNLTSQTEQSLTGQQLFDLSNSIRILERLSIKRLKEMLKNLLKQKPLDEKSIKIIKSIIAHKKGQINLMQ